MSPCGTWAYGGSASVGGLSKLNDNEYIKTQCIKFKENCIWSIFLYRELRPKPEIGRPTFDFQQFFCGKQLLHLKRHPKRICYVAFEENHSNCFTETRTSKAKIGQPNLNFHQFFYSKRLIHSKKHIKSVYTSSLKKSVWAVFSCICLY